jgi:hypothetical protein
MTTDEIKQIQSIIQDSIKTVVDDKIDRLDNKLETYITKDENDKEKIFAWQDNVMPTIEQTKKIMDFGSVGAVVIKTMVLIGSLLAGLWGAFTFISKLKK